MLKRTASARRSRRSAQSVVRSGWFPPARCDLFLISADHEFTSKVVSPSTQPHPVLLHLFSYLPSMLALIFISDGVCLTMR